MLSAFDDGTGERRVIIGIRVIHDISELKTGELRTCAEELGDQGRRAVARTAPGLDDECTRHAGQRRVLKGSHETMAVIRRLPRIPSVITVDGDENRMIEPSSGEREEGVRDETSSRHRLPVTVSFDTLLRGTRDGVVEYLSDELGRQSRRRHGEGGWRGGARRRAR